MAKFRGNRSYLPRSRVARDVFLRDATPELNTGTPTRAIRLRPPFLRDKYLRIGLNFSGALSFLEVVNFATRRPNSM